LRGGGGREGGAEAGRAERGAERESENKSENKRASARARAKENISVILFRSLLFERWGRSAQSPRTVTLISTREQTTDLYSQILLVLNDIIR